MENKPSSLGLVDLQANIERLGAEVTNLCRLLGLSPVAVRDTAAELQDDAKSKIIAQLRAVLRIMNVNLAGYIEALGYANSTLTELLHDDLGLSQ